MNDYRTQRQATTNGIWGFFGGAIAWSVALYGACLALLLGLAGLCLFAEKIFGSNAEMVIMQALGTIGAYVWAILAIGIIPWMFIMDYVRARRRRLAEQEQKGIHFETPSTT